MQGVFVVSTETANHVDPKPQVESPETVLWTIISPNASKWKAGRLSVDRSQKNEHIHLARLRRESMCAPQQASW